MSSKLDIIKPKNDKSQLSSGVLLSLREDDTYGLVPKVEFT